jgi:integrase
LEWANKYLAYSKQKHSEKTLQGKVLSFKLFLKLTKAANLNSITPAMAMSYLQEQSKVRSGYAANKDRKNLAAAWKWGEAYLDGFPIIANPFLKAEKFKEDRSTRYVPPEKDFWKVVDAATGQDKTMLLALFYLGARRGEIFRLKWDDIDFINNRVRLGTHKTRDGSMKYDWLPLAQELKASLISWKEGSRFKNQWVFTIQHDTPSPYNQPGEPYKLRSLFMKDLCKKAEVKPFGYHAIRHLHASILFNEGSELSTVQRQLRHASPTTTVRYLRTLGYEAEHGRKVLSVIEGRRPAMAPIIQFTAKKNPQDGRLEDSVHTPGTQAG